MKILTLIAALPFMAAPVMEAPVMAAPRMKTKITRPIKIKKNLTGIKIKGDNFYVDGKKTQFAGNHTWNNVQPIGGKTVGMNRVTGNWTRLWTIETRGADFAATKWGSNTPGVQRVGSVPWKNDGSLKNSYYTRLENTIKKADKKGLTVSISLFEGSIQGFDGAWENHPFNGLKDGPSIPHDIHTKGEWNKYQRAHVKRVAEIASKYDNVMAEVGNELNSASTKWFQPKVVEWWNKFTDKYSDVDKYIGVSYATGIRGEQHWMKRTGADFVIPSVGYGASPALRVPGFKGPQILDTDHGWALHSNVGGIKEAWDSGKSVWLMDGFEGSVLKNQDSLVPDRNFINGVTD